MIAPSPKKKRAATPYPYAPEAGKAYMQPVVAPPAKKGIPLERHGTTAGAPGKAVSYANRWRENYNPLRHLTIRRAVELLEMAQRGDTALLQWTFRFIERRYPTLSALISRCEAPLLNFDWEIKIKEELPPGATEEQAKAQQAALKDAYDCIDNLKQAIQHLHLAEFRGYSHIQKHRTNDGEVYHLETLDQWVVCRDGLYGDWFWNPDSRFVTMPAQFLGEANRIGGDQLPIGDFIIRTVDRPIDEIALINFIRANLCEKDWDGFIEIYGIPGGVVVMPPNVPQGKEAEYESAAQRVAEGGSGAIPNGSAYEPNDGPRGVDPFTPRTKHLDEQLIMVGTGGKLTMLAESGSGTLAGDAHSDTFEDVAESRSQKISEAFQKQFDAEIIDRDFPGQPVLAYFQLAAREETDTGAFVGETLQLSQAGYQVDPQQIEDKTSYKVTVKAPPQVDPEASRGADPKNATNNDKPNPGLPKNPPHNRNRGPDLPPLEESGQVHYAKALAQDMQIVAEELQALLKIQDDRVLARRAVALKDKLDDLKADILHLPQAAQALAEVQIAALFTGLTEKRSVSNRDVKVLNGDVPGHDFHGNQYTEEAAEEHRRLRVEADAAAGRAHELERSSGFEANSEIAAAHREAQSKYKAAADHLTKFNGTRSSARLMRQKAGIHRDYANYHARQNS